jgi:hypothetical protein
MNRSASKTVVAIGLASGLLLGIGPTLPQAFAEGLRPHGACSNASLHGSYGFYRTGNTPDGTLAALGLVIYDGKGNFTGSQSISRGGEYDFDIPIAGLYAVAPDCTGAGYTPEGIEFSRLVVVDGGNGVYIFSESPGNGVYGVGRRTGFPLDANGN